MLQPKKTKFRKAHKGRIHGNAKGGTDLNFGSIGLKATRPNRITARQIEAARRAITRHIRRQGKGKGSVEYWAAKVKPGRIMFEMDGVPHDLAVGALERAQMKLPLKSKIVTRIGE